MTWQAKANRIAKSTARRLGNVVLIDGVTAYGWLESPEEKVYDGVVVVTDYTLEVPFVSWSYISEGTLVVVDGVNYVAREQSRPNSDRSSIIVPLKLLNPSGPLPPPSAVGPTVVIIGGDFV
jgi:hypothetical protein